MFEINESTKKRLQSNDQKTVLILEDLLLEILKIVELYSDFSEFGEPTASHYKKLLFSEKIGASTLKVELIQFTGRAWTGLHTHPEYVFDMVLQGQILEKNFSQINGEYVETEEVTREEGSFRKFHDSNGHPHNVTSVEGSSLVICLSFGKNEVSPIVGVTNLD